MSRSAPDSGRIELVNGVVRYHSNIGGPWELRLSDVLVIGEMTNDHGPLGDDYFLCFATDPDGWYEASFYAEGRDEFIECLSVALGYPLQLLLVGSTDYTSRVMWPASLADEPMFTFTDVPRSRIMMWIFGARQNTQTYDPAVLEYLTDQTHADDGMRPEYDFTNARPNPYTDRLSE